MTAHTTPHIARATFRRFCHAASRGFQQTDCARTSHDGRAAAVSRSGTSILVLALAAFMAGCSDGPNNGGDAPAPDTAESSDDADRPTPHAIDQAVDSAEQYLRSDRLDEAETILDRLIEQAPDVLVAREMRAQIYFLRGSRARREGNEAEARPYFESSHDEYRAALEIDDETAGLHHSAGMMAIAAERTDDAITHMEAAVERNSVHPQYPLHLAQLYMQQERWDEANRMLERVLTIDPDEPYAYASLAGVALEQGEIEQATEHIRQAREIEPDDLGLRVQESRIHRRGGDPDRTIELLSSLPEAERADEAVANELGRAYTQLGEHEQAARAWTLRFRYYENDWRAAVHAADAWLEAGEPEEAHDLHRLAELQAHGHHELEELDRRIRRALRESAD